MLSFRQRFRNWAFRRTTESGTVVLNQRRIYILPTRQGLGFAGVLVLMLLGDINYGLSLGYALTFLLTAASGMSMLHTFRNMASIEIRAGRNLPVFAGETAHFQFHFDNPTQFARYRLYLHDDAGHGTVFDLPAQASHAVQLALPARQRGWLDSGQLTLYSEFPLGLFHAWTYIHFDTRCLVYPQPAPSQPFPVQATGSATGMRIAQGDEDFSGLRNYVSGDSLPRIAWKTLARAQDLQVKQFSALQGDELWLDWSELAHLTAEHRLQLLTRWVLDAEQAGLRYGLRLPDAEAAPALGAAHAAECLRRLALFGMEHA